MADLSVLPDLTIAVDTMGPIGLARYTVHERDARSLLWQHGSKRRLPWTRATT